MSGLLLVSLTGLAQPTVTRQPEDQVVSLGGQASFTVDADSLAPPAELQWRREEEPIEGAKKRTLVLPIVGLADVGGYDVVVTDQSGSVTSRLATLTIDPTFIKILEGPVVTDKGGTINFAWGDSDGDGDLDLYVANTSASSAATTNFVYQNQGDGTFLRLTNATVENPSLSFAPTWGDYDNDGDLDLFVAHDGGLHNDLYRNEGSGAFVRLVSRLTRTPTLDGGNSYDALWGDFDRDGLLDLFVANMSSQNDCLYRNLGSGEFAKLSAATAGSAVSDGLDSCMVCAADYDGDDDLDIYVANPNGTNLLHRNSGGFFEGVAAGSIGVGKNSWAGVWGDYDNDGRPDLLVVNTGGAPSLHHNLDGTNFVNEATAAGLTMTTPMIQATWGDFDNDGYLDAFLVGHNAPPHYLLHNQGDGTFKGVEVGSPLRDGTRPIVAGWADYDNDGWLDLLIGEGNGTDYPNLLYRNNLSSAGNANHWLKVRLVGQTADSSAIGAKVRVKATIGGKEFWQLREVAGAPAFSGGHGLVVHFGLGDATAVDTLRVEWPSGTVEEVGGVPADQLITRSETCLISPRRPTGGLGGDCVLSVARGFGWQWLTDAGPIDGATNRTLTLTDIQAEDAGRYGVAISLTGQVLTNWVYLHVDSQFTQEKADPIVSDPSDTYVPAFADYDNDGYPDAFVPNGGNEGPTLPFLYRNDGTGGFVRVTEAEAGSLVSDPVQSAQGVWADMDNDGDVDLFVGNAAPTDACRFYRNAGGGRFESVLGDVTAQWAPFTWGSAWGDYDNDGWIDLYVAMGWRQANARDVVLHNLRDGGFEPCAGIPYALMDVNFGTWGDADNDGDLDLLVAEFSGGRNIFYRNHGRGRFVVDDDAGLGVGASGAVGPTWADLDNDGDLDVFLTRNNAPCYLFRNDGTGHFTADHSTSWLQTMGLLAAPGDYDNDGDQDLLVTRGQGTGEPCLLLRNDGDWQFVPVTSSALATLRTHATGCAWVDVNNDGFLDLFIGTVSQEKNLLFRNNGNDNRWIIVHLKGTTSNATGLGARVRLETVVARKLYAQMRQITGGPVDDLRAHFGLGQATSVYRLHIDWPSGTTQAFTNLEPNQILTIVEPRRPVLAGQWQAGSGLQLDLSGDPMAVYQIQTSTNLADWVPLQTVTNQADGITAMDPDALQHGQRFYKAERIETTE